MAAFDEQEAHLFKLFSITGIRDLLKGYAILFEI